MLFAMPHCVAAQNQPPVESPQKLINQAVTQFDLDDGTLRDGVERLAREQTGNFGLEEVLKEKYSDPPILNPRFSIHLTNATVKDVLDRLCQHDPKYVWSSNGHSINIYPRSTVDDSAYLLNRNVPRVTLQNTPGPDKALFALDEQLPLPKEQFGYIQAGGDNTYESPWSASFENITVRQFVNRITENVGPSTIWVFQGSKQERLFSIIRIHHH
jgi:hypothetical protein